MKIKHFSFETITAKVLLLGVMVSATLINTAKANAQSTTVNFSGTVLNTCAIGTPVSGTLVLDKGGTTMSTSTLGSFVLTCNGQVTMDITGFSADKNNPATISTGTATVNSPIATEMVSATLESTGTGIGSTIYPSSPGVINGETFTVGVSLNNSGDAGASLIQKGIYAYQVNVLVNPQ
jgi:hypothetical protein